MDEERERFTREWVEKSIRVMNDLNELMERCNALMAEARGLATAMLIVINGEIEQLEKKEEE